MNKIFFGILVSLILFSYSCSTKKGAIIYYKSKIINLGNIEFKKTYNGNILIKNLGDDVLQIGEATADCSCTVPNIENTKINPGDSTNIHFELTPAIDGYIQQSIFINNNSTNENRVLFLIRAKVNLINK